MACLTTCLFTTIDSSDHVWLYAARKRSRVSKFRRVRALMPLIARLRGLPRCCDFPSLLRRSVLDRMARLRRSRDPHVDIELPRRATEAKGNFWRNAARSTVKLAGWPIEVARRPMYMPGDCGQENRQLRAGKLVGDTCMGRDRKRGSELEEESRA